MKLARPRRRQAPETIIALVDVTFFLLVFFLLIGRMDATAPFKVDPPVSAAGSDMPGGGITIAVAEDGGLALDGGAIARADLLAGLRARAADDPNLLVRLNADRAAPLRDVLPLVAELEAAGLRDVVLVITPAPPP